MRKLEFERFLVESVDIHSKKKAVISRVAKILSLLVNTGLWFYFIFINKKSSSN